MVKFDVEIFEITLVFVLLDGIIVLDASLLFFDIVSRDIISLQLV